MEYNEKLLIDYDTRLKNLKQGITSTEQELNTLTTERDHAISAFQSNMKKLEQVGVHTCVYSLYLFISIYKYLTSLIVHI